MPHGNKADHLDSLREAYEQEARGCIARVPLLDLFRTIQEVETLRSRVADLVGELDVLRPVEA